MDLHQFIESGIIEEFVLGLCSAEESARVEAMARQYPEVQKEIDALREALGNYSTVYSKKAPSKLKDQIWDKLSNEGLTQNDTQKNEPKVIAISSNKNGNSFYRLMAAASITLFMVSAGINAIMYFKLKDTQTELSTLLAEKIQMAEQFNTLQTNFEQTKNTMNSIANAQNTFVKMAGVKDSSLLATVVWSSNNQEVFLIPGNLPVLEKGKQYQLWAIVDGKPVDMGMLTNGFNTNEAYKMKITGGAQAFAITIEPEGGNVNPTLEQMVVIGNV